MYKKITKWQRKFHALMETIYDAYGLPYDFNLYATLTYVPTEEEARDAYNRMMHTMMLKSAMRDFPLMPTELERKTLERVETDEFPDQLVLKPTPESKPRLTKEQRMPYRMMGEYVDRKIRTDYSKAKRKPVKKIKSITKKIKRITKKK